MSDPVTTLEARLMQAHGIAFSMSDISGDVCCPESMRSAWYGVAELIQQARDALQQLDVRARQQEGSE